MNIRTIHAVYFSATGTTAKVAETLARELGRELAQINKVEITVEIRDFSLPQARELTYSFAESDLVVCGVPTYAGRVPNLLLPFIKEHLRGHKTPLIPLVLFGNRNYDDSLIELKILLEESGFISAAACAFVGEHSFSDTLGAKRPDESDLAELTVFAHKAAAKIAAVENAEDLPPLTVSGSLPLRPYYTPRDRNGAPINILKVKPKTSESCIGCGLCANVCTMGAIPPENPREVTGICTKCCACVKKCPVTAKYYDDEGYLYHKRELEEMYCARAQNECFL